MTRSVFSSNVAVNRFEIRFTIGGSLIMSTNDATEAVEAAKVMPGMITIKDNDGKFPVAARLTNGVFQTLSPDMEAALR